MDVKRKFINIVSNYKNSLYTHMYVYIYVYTYTCVSKRPYRVSWILLANEWSNAQITFSYVESLSPYLLDVTPSMYLSPRLGGTREVRRVGGSWTWILELRSFHGIVYIWKERKKFFPKWRRNKTDNDTSKECCWIKRKKETFIKLDKRTFRSPKKNFIGILDF